MAEKISIFRGCAIQTVIITYFDRTVSLLTCKHWTGMEFNTFPSIYLNPVLQETSLSFFTTILKN